MRFLLASQKRNRRRLRLEELILLALRCLLILLIVLAVAGPHTTRPRLQIGSERTTDHVFILDDSASMAAVGEDDSAFATTVADLADLVGQASSKDSVAIYRTSDLGAPWRPLGGLSETEEEQLARRIRKLRCSHTRGGLIEALAAARKDLKDSTHQKRLYVLSDFRHRNYTGKAVDNVSRELAALARDKVELVFVDYAPPAGANLTIEGIELTETHAIVDAVSHLVVTVRNNGDQSMATVPLQTRINGQAQPTVTLPTLPPQQSREVIVPCLFTKAGPTRVRVAVPDDALATDNAAYLAVRARRWLSVLIVDGQLGADRSGRLDSYYLKTALDPDGDHASGIRPVICRPDQLLQYRLDEYAAVILANVAELPGRMGAKGKLTYLALEALEQYVRDGGGLAIFTGDRLKLPFYNGVMYRGGRGLSPLKLRAPLGDAVAKKRYVTFRADSVAALPMLSGFRGETAALANLLRFYRYTPTEPVADDEEAGADEKEAGGDDGPPKVLARFTDEQGSPAIVRRSFGHGTVMMFYSTAGAGWNNWAKGVTLTYVPVMHEMIAYLAQRPEAAALVGSPIQRSAEHVPDDVKVSVKTPDPLPGQPPVLLPIEMDQGRRIVRFTDTRWAGVYEFNFPVASAPGGEADSAIVLAARNVDGAEGDLAKAEPDKLRNLAKTDPGKSGTSGGGAVKDEITYIHRLDEARTTRAREYWQWLLAAALLVGAAEIFLAQRFGHYPARPGRAGSRPPRAVPAARPTVGAIASADKQ